MKKNLAKILVLVLLVSLFVPSWASAATYNATLTLSGGGTTADPAVANMVADSTLLSGLYSAFGELRGKAQAAYDGTTLANKMDEFLAAYIAGGTTWESKVDSVNIVGANADAIKDVIKTPSESTVADLVTAAGDTTISSTFEIESVTYTVTLTLTGYSAPAPGPAVDNPPATTTSEDEYAVSNADIQKYKESGTPITLPTTFEIPEDSADAPKFKIDIPEDAGSDGVKVEIPVKNLSDTSVVVLVHADGTEEILPKTALVDNRLLINIDDDVTIKVIDNTVDFSDIDALTDAQKAAIAFVAARELFQGIDIGVFAPDETMNRYMFVTVIWRLESKPETTAAIEFEDVASGKWYSEAVAWATANGIIKGYSDTDFGGTDPVTREQIALILWRYCGMPAPTAAIKTSAHDWAAEAMSWAVENGLFDASVDAQGNATRLDVAVVLKAFVNILEGADMVVA